MFIAEKKNKAPNTSVPMSLTLEGNLTPLLLWHEAKRKTKALINAMDREGNT